MATATAALKAPKTPKTPKTPKSVDEPKPKGKPKAPNTAAQAMPEVAAGPKFDPARVAPPGAMRGIFVLTDADPAVKDRIARAAEELKKLSDPTRLHMVLVLAEGEVNVGDLCTQVGMTQPAVSHHLALLRHGRVVSPRRQGKENFYSLTDTGRSLVAAVQGLI